MKKIIKYLKDLREYILHGDDLGSYVLNFVVAFIFIKYIFFPSLGFALNNDFPVVAIVSGSMEHKIVNNEICGNPIVDQSSKNLDLNSWWNTCSKYYITNFNLSLNDFNNFDYNNGLNIGDVMILYGSKPQNINLGEVLVFIPQDRRFFEQKGPVIHRVVKKWVDVNGKYHFQTKGDHNGQSFNNFENDIIEDNVIGVAVVRVPYIGYAKLAMNNIMISIGQLFRWRLWINH